MVKGKYEWETGYCKHGYFRWGEAGGFSDCVNNDLVSATGQLTAITHLTYSIILKANWKSNRCNFVILISLPLIVDLFFQS